MNSQIQNAALFLQHEKVLTASEEQKRSFLSQKGLSGDEINEALNRASVASNYASGYPSSSSGAGGANAPNTSGTNALMRTNGGANNTFGGSSSNGGGLKQKKSLVFFCSKKIVSFRRV